MDEELEDIHCGLHKHEGKLKYLENQSRRNNVRIDGIPEEDNETWLNTETQANEVLQEKLQLSFELVIELEQDQDQVLLMVSKHAQEPQCVVYLIGSKRMKFLEPPEG